MQARTSIKANPTDKVSLTLKKGQATIAVNGSGRGDVTQLVLTDGQARRLLGDLLKSYSVTPTGRVPRADRKSKEERAIQAAHSPVAQQVLHALTWHGSQHPEGWLSVQNLAPLVDRSEATVRTNLHHLRLIGKAECRQTRKTTGTKPHKEWRTIIHATD